MKAAVIEKQGGIENIVYRDFPDPQIGRGDLLIRVKACGLNYFDIFVRRGMPGLPVPMPWISGADVAGEVAAVGGQDSMDFAPLSKGSYRAVDQSKIELLELSVEFERANKIGRQRQLVFVAGRRIEYLGDQLAHGRPIASEEVVYFSEHQSRYYHDARIGQNRSVFRKTRFVIRRPS